MRTTLTLEDEIAEKLKELSHRQRTSFKETVNSVLRLGLEARQQQRRTCTPYKVQTFDSRLRAGVDPLRLNQLSDELQADEAILQALAVTKPR